MIDKQGFRLNVGIIIVNAKGQVFWAKRAGREDAWQFPQGGVKNYETLQEAMYRELQEEVGLLPADVEVLGVTQRWLHYRLPHHLRRHSKPYCVGQKQKWFLLKLIGQEDHIRFHHTESPEFDDWKWVDFLYPIDQVIVFKRDVYQKVLQEFYPLVFKQTP